MSDYTEMVKALTCGNDGKLPCHNNECPYWVDKWHGIGLCNVTKKDADAAAAIESLQAQLPKRGEIVRCKECIHFTQGGWCDREFDWFPVDEDDFCSMAEKMEVQDG